MQRRYFITKDVLISKKSLMEILKMCLLRGDSLFWISTYWFEVNAIIIRSVDNVLVRLRREELMYSLRKLLEYFSHAVHDGELDGLLFTADDADLVLQVACFGRLIFD